VNEYPQFHQSRLNLAIHIIMVPVFVAGIAGLITSLMTGRWLAAGGCALIPIVSMAAQGVGHKHEPVPPLPFTGPGNVLGRIFAEQFFRFWVFLLGGGFLRAWRGAR
jgi:hypothetical protein